MYSSGGHQCKSVLILGPHVLVQPSQTLTFPVNKIIIKSPNAQNTGQTCVVSSDLLFVSDIISFSSIICADKRD